MFYKICGPFLKFVKKLINAKTLTKYKKNISYPIVWLSPRWVNQNRG